MFDRYAIDEPDGYYLVNGGTTTGWVHAVLVYHGVGVGITVYQDGNEIGTDTEKAGGIKQKGNGLVFIGKRTGGLGDRYASASVDEMKFYNRQLLEKEIRDMYRKL